MSKSRKKDSNFFESPSNSLGWQMRSSFGVGPGAAGVDIAAGCCAVVCWIYCPTSCATERNLVFLATSSGTWGGWSASPEVCSSLTGGGSAYASRIPRLKFSAASSNGSANGRSMFDNWLERSSSTLSSSGPGIGMSPPASDWASSWLWKSSSASESLSCRLLYFPKSCAVVVGETVLTDGCLVDSSDCLFFLLVFLLSGETLGPASLCRLSSEISWWISLKDGLFCFLAVDFCLRVGVQRSSFPLPAVLTV